MQKRGSNTRSRTKQVRQEKKSDLKRSHNYSKAVKESNVNAQDAHGGPMPEFFPDYTVWIVHVVTLLVRLGIVCHKQNWWILHPDEIFQSVEVAHSEVYGYGFRPYEFLAPPNGNNISEVERQEAALGMYSMRSFLYPRVYMLVFRLARLLGLDSEPLLVAKIFHSMVAAHLPLAVFHFTSAILPFRNCAVLAAILVSASQHLTIFGTHTLVNSFISPIVFEALSWIATGIKKATNSTSKVMLQNGHTESPKIHTTSGENGASFRHTNSFDHSDTENNNHMHIANHVTPCCGYGDVTRTPLNVQTSQSIHKLTFILCGVICGMLCYVRVDLVMFLFLTLFALFWPLTCHFATKFKAAIHLGIGMKIGILMGGIEDYYTYGSLFISPLQWFRFNVQKDLSSILFGWQGSLQYFNDIILYDFTMQSFFVLFVLANILLLTCSNFYAKNEKYAAIQLKTMTIGIILFLIYSCKGHKENRFLHQVIVLIMVNFAITIIMLFNFASYLGLRWNTAKIILFSLIGIHIINTCGTFQIPKNHSNQRWSYLGIGDTNNIIECVNFISKQQDCTGVFSDRSIHYIGGYTTLHTNVPIFSLVHYEFEEFDKQARKAILSVDPLSPIRHTNVTLLGKISNYISVENTPLLLKYLLNDPKYNYYVLKKSRQFINIGFREVFSAGTMRVMKRTTERGENERLYDIAKRIAVGLNGTILEYEGSWLMTFGLDDLAVERLTAALKMDPSRVRAYQLLSMIYKDMNRNQGALRWIKKCIQQVNREKCMQIQPKVVLHREYDINLDVHLKNV